MSTQRGRSRKKMKNTYKPRIIALACLLVLAISAAIGGGLAKYTQQVKDEGTGAPFDVALVDSADSGEFAIYENANTMETNGDYATQEAVIPSGTLEDGSLIGNSYFLIPGTEIPKNPYITLTNKTSIPAYLYLAVEVETEGESFDEDVSYAVDSNYWTPINNNIEGDTRLVYAYSLNGTIKKVAEGDDATFSVLDDNQIVVASLKKLAKGGKLSFTGYLIQAPNEAEAPADVKADAEKIWKRQDGSNTFLEDTTIKLTNKFEPGVVTATIDEKFENNKKDYIKIQNSGNVPAFLRAKLVVNWVDENGYILANPTNVTDPTAGLIDTANWQLCSDGYYYYKGYVEAGGSRDLTTGVVTLTEGCQVEIIAEAIQATGFVNPLQPGSETAVHNAWKHDFVNGAWTES